MSGSQMVLWFFIRSLKGFFKEIFTGMGKRELEKRETPEDRTQYRKENPTVKDKIKNATNNHVHLTMDWLMKSRRAVAFLLFSTLISLFFNYRLVSHVVADKRVPTPNRDERVLKGTEPKVKKDENKPVVPLPSKAQRQREYIDMMKDVDAAYKER